MIMSPIESNLQHVKAEIAAAIAGLPGDRRKTVTLVAVSKAKHAEAIRAAFTAGQRIFGENYVQEGARKIAELADLKARGIEWHFIGPLQSNKAGLLAGHFDWMHSLDRLKIAEALSRIRVGAPLNVCLQVNVSGEPSKGGVPPEQAQSLARQVMMLPGIRLRGLMAVIENTPDELKQRTQFRAMHLLFEELNRSGIVMDGDAAYLASNEDVKEFYLGLAKEGKKSFRDTKFYKRRKRWLA